MREDNGIIETNIWYLNFNLCKKIQENRKKKNTQ